MKRLLLVAAAASLLAVFTPSARAALVHRWSFSESGGAGTVLIDSVGGANGTIVDAGPNNATVGGGLVTLAGGTKGTADYVALPSGLVSGLTNATIEVWATQLGVQAWSRVFDFGSATTNNLMMSWTQGTDINNDRVGFTVGGVEQRIDTTMAPYTVGVQNHIVMALTDVPGGTTINVYKNGALRGTLNSTYKLSQLVDTNVWLGQSQYPDNTANAAYNEFRIYNEALPGYKVYQSYAAGPNQFASPAYPDLAHRYSFNEASGTTAADSVGGANGTINNGALTGTGSLALNGTNTFVALPINGTISSLASITVEGWANWSGAGSGWQRLFDFGNNTTSYMFLSPNGPRFAITTGSGGGEQTVNFSPFPTGPVHFAVTLDDASDTARVYLNGRLMATNTGVTLRPSDLGATVNNWLGRSQYGADPYFGGSMDEFRIYGRALTAFEVGESRLVGPDHLNSRMVNVVNTSAKDYRTVSIAPYVNANDAAINLLGGVQVLGGVPFDLVGPTTGNNTWNAYGATGSNRQVTIPVTPKGQVAEVDLILGTYWGEQVPGTFASLLFTATDGSTFTVELDGNSELRDYQIGGHANQINGITTTQVYTRPDNANMHVDVTRVVLPDDWWGKTLASVTVRDFGANGQGSDGFQRVFIAGLTLVEVPEPSSAVLLTLGVAGLALATLRRRAKRT